VTQQEREWAWRHGAGVTCQLNISRTRKKDGLRLSDVFDWEARRELQAFAADAVRLWMFNRN
jgi:hypothetical protein